MPGQVSECLRELHRALQARAERVGAVAGGLGRGSVLPTRGPGKE